ncbi:MAG TPA: signal peptidase II, partial [Chromatiales bacterium]|nr:signal peptidase II [Chromatiales bacterium]
MLRWLWLSAAVLVLDQATKLAAERWIAPRAPIEVLPFLNLVLTYNTGAAFSFLADAGGWQRWLFLALALGVSAGLTLWLRRLRPCERLTAGGIALVVGGALGNAVDRIA